MSLLGYLKSALSNYDEMTVGELDAFLRANDISLAFRSMTWRWRASRGEAFNYGDTAGEAIAALIASGA